MADEPTKEQKFSCGCHVVDGVLVAECTQVAPSGEISAERHEVLKPYSAKCARLAVQHDAEVAAQKVRNEAELKAKADADLAAAQAEVNAAANPTIVTLVDSVSSSNVVTISTPTE